MCVTSAIGMAAQGMMTPPKGILRVRDSEIGKPPPQAGIAASDPKIQSMYQNARLPDGVDPKTSKGATFFDYNSGQVIYRNNGGDFMPRDGRFVSGIEMPRPGSTQKFDKGAYDKAVAAERANWEKYMSTVNQPAAADSKKSKASPASSPASKPKTPTPADVLFPAPGRAAPAKSEPIDILAQDGQKRRKGSFVTGDSGLTSSTTKKTLLGE